MIKKSKVQSLSTPKTNWCLSLIINNYYQKQMLWIETLKKKIQFPIKEMNSNTPFLLILSHIYIYIYIYII